MQKYCNALSAERTFSFLNSFSPHQGIQIS